MYTPSIPNHRLTPPPQGSGTGAATARAEEKRQTGEREGTRPAPQLLTEQESRELHQLKQRDREVRAHEAAHLAVGASVTRGGMQFSYERGPDGVMYAVGGEVSLDISRAATPEQTLRKAETIRRAALAPADPSAQDRSVAAKATQMAARARIEIAQQQQAEEGQLVTGGFNLTEEYHEEDPYAAAMPGVDEYA